MSNPEKVPLLSAQRVEDTESHEPSLAELQQDAREAQHRYIKAWSKSTSGRCSSLLMCCTTFILTMALIFGLIVIADDYANDYDSVAHRVPLEAHIMSKCPDARDCLRKMILPAMIKISDKVDFKLSFIGKTTDHDDGVECMHGSEECLGNLIEICAAHTYPDPKIYLGFTMCLSKAYEDIPKRELIEDCALEHGISMERLNECTMHSTKSSDMLKASFNRSATAGVTKSCTVRLDGKVRCIRDGGEWSDCDGGSSSDDLVRDILALASSRD